ncbi:MAG: nucleoside-diphosphate kinase [Acidobacteriota bacterium]
MERTLTIIKPDSMKAGNAGNILALLEREGFRILAIRRIRMSESQARGFYEVHAQRPFYDSLVAFMTECPVIAAVLERDDAVAALRRVMGATDSTQAEEGTVRNLYGTDIERNAIHGSDSQENAYIESQFFFSRAELIALS